MRQFENAIKNGINIKKKNKTMNNKQSSVEWYIIERHNIEIQSRLGLISPIEYDAKLIKIEEQAKEMEKKQHKKTWLDSTSQFDNAAEMTFKKDFDEHYNKTYGDDKQ